MSSSAQIKTSELSSKNILNKTSDYFVILDILDTTQGGAGSTKRSPISSLNTFVWNTSALYGIDKIPSIFTTVNSNSSNWNNINTTVQTNSSNWNNVNKLSGGNANQIFRKNTSNTTTEWVNKRIVLSYSPITTNSSVNFNALSADKMVVPISGNGTVAVTATLNTPINGYDGQLIMWEIRHLTANTFVNLNGFRIPSTATLSWTNSANRIDKFASEYNLNDNKWDVVSFLPNYSIV
jgi:hypothetical protein